MKAQGNGVFSLQEVRARFLYEFSTVFEVEIGEGNCSAGIQVSAIAPGIVETETAKSTFPEFALKEYVRNVPLGRLGMEEGLAGLVTFPCSKESSYITGQVLAVGGGYTMI
ncbi:MAG: SDR family oxidoreductase [Syntrophobacteraceae bacterium]|jgi:NAD(P)-dependent dehydrogenase (short-subunit alcohol dehydrogenase family)